MLHALRNQVYNGDRALFEQDLLRIYANCREFNYAPGNEYARYMYCNVRVSNFYAPFYP